MTVKATIFDRSGLTAEEIELERLRRNLSKPTAYRLGLMFEMLSLSDIFQKNAEKTQMTHLKKEFLDFLQAMNEQEVAYLIVGGFAVNSAGFSRYTSDLDLWVHDTPENRKRLVAACEKYGVPGAANLETMDWVAGWTGFRLENGFEVEIMASIAGFDAADLPDCLTRAEFVTFGEISFPTLHLDDLLIAKKALSRPKDEEDVRQLERIKKLRAK